MPDFASVIGQWGKRFNSDGVAAMHAHLLPTGEVLFHDWNGVDTIRLWNPVTGQFKVVPPPLSVPRFPSRAMSCSAAATRFWRMAGSSLPAVASLLPRVPRKPVSMIRLLSTPGSRCRS